MVKKAGDFLGKMHAIMMLSLHRVGVTAPNFFKPEYRAKIFTTYNTAWRENSEDSSMNTPAVKTWKPVLVLYILMNKTT